MARNNDEITLNDILIKLHAIAMGDGGQWIGNLSDEITEELFRMRLVVRDHGDREYLLLTDRGEDMLDLVNLACTGG